MTAEVSAVRPDAAPVRQLVSISIALAIGHLAMTTMDVRATFLLAIAKTVGVLPHRP